MVLDLDEEPAPDRALVEAIAQSADDLRRRIDHHQALVARLGGEEAGVETCLDAERASRARVRSALADAIETLDGTRRAFKSRELEVLRKRLTRVLVELD
jgi:hypothetical protein